MSIVSDFVEQVVRSALSEGMRKLGGKRKQRIAKEIERIIKPAKRQISRKRTVRSRSKAASAAIEPPASSPKRR